MESSPPLPPSIPPNQVPKTESAVGLFHLLTRIAAVLKEADRRKQTWKTETEGMRYADGALTDGLDIRIRIYPTGMPHDVDIRRRIVEEPIELVLGAAPPRSPA